VKALIKTSDNCGYSLEVLKSVEKVNDRQKIILFDKLYHYFQGNLKGKRIALLGLSFKPNTDDMREAPALTLIQKLNEAGCTIYAYDPVAMEESQRKIGNAVHYCKDLYETLENADAMLLVTEWTEFRILDLKKVKTLMKNAAIFDGRNIYNAQEMKNSGIDYFCIGKKTNKLG
jgi:UDPglucose 6-dehydrogenase